MIRRLGLAVLLLAAWGCQPPPGAGTCAPCVQADACCAAHTANPESNCQLHATCITLTPAGQIESANGCAYYLRVASTPPAPAVCGAHPDAE